MSLRRKDPVVALPATGNVTTPRTIGFHALSDVLKVETLSQRGLSHTAEPIWNQTQLSSFSTESIGMPKRAYRDDPDAPSSSSRPKCSSDDNPGSFSITSSDLINHTISKAAAALADYIGYAFEYLEDAGKVSIAVPIISTTLSHVVKYLEFYAETNKFEIAAGIMLQREEIKELHELQNKELQTINCNDKKRQEEKLKRKEEELKVSINARINALIYAPDRPQKKFDTDFLNEIKVAGVLYDVITAANFMEASVLLDLTCNDVANSLMGMSVDELNQFLSPRPTRTTEDKMCL